MDACVCVSKTSSEATDDLIPGNPFFGKNRSRKEYDEDETSSHVCLNHMMWSKLPELLIHIFARLPVKDILRIRCLSKARRTTITSPEFQQAFANASLVRVALMISEVVDGTMFFTQENKEECFRPYIARCPEMVLNTNIVATADGLVCVVECEMSHFRNIVGIRVFVMNVVGRELPCPRIKTSLPTLVRMETNVEGSGYVIMFIYTCKGDIITSDFL